MSSKRSAELKAIPYMFLDLTPGHGNLLGESYWEILSPWHGGSWMLNTGASPNAAVVSSLSQILEGSPHRKYYLSPKACLGILRRAWERGKELPLQLKEALMAQAGLASVPTVNSSLKAYHINQRDEGIDLGEVSGALMATSNMQMQTFITGEPIAFAANQRDEVRDLHNVAGALGAQPGMKQQTFIAAGFSAGQGAKAGGIGYQEECAPTLKAAESGTNMVPSVLCLNDQGGSVMECTEDMIGTLRAQEHGHQPLVFENHGIDARYTGPHPIVPTLSARAGTGGNNLPLVTTEGTPESLQVFSRQRVDIFVPGEVVSTESARQHKDATDLIYQESVGALTSSDRKGPNSQYVSQDKLIVETPLLIRRLTPLECERLQGFPDGWTELPSASDSARYKALGNSVAIPCVEYVMHGIALALMADV